jgi:HK97 family phage major capsid protein
MMDKSLTQLLEQFNATSGEIRAALDTQQTEIRAHGQAREETGRQISDLDARMVQLSADIRGAQTRLEAAETEFARNGFRGQREPAKTPGQIFTESDTYKDAVRNNRERSDVVGVPSFWTPANTLITTDPASGGAILAPYRVPSVVGIPEQQLRIRDLLNVEPTDADSIQYVQETGFINNAAPVAEGTDKPESELSYALKTAPAEVIAHWLPATRQIIASPSQMRNMIDVRLTYGLKVAEEEEILYGDGTTPNLQGIATHPDVQTYSWSSGLFTDNRLDAIRRAMAMARLAGYPANGTVMHPNDWATFETLKGSDGHYLWGVAGTGAEARLWRILVVESEAVTEGEPIVGAWSLGATLWDREQATVRLSDSHGDYFIKNKVAVLAEERVALTIYRPEAFVVVTLDGPPVS